MLVSNPLLWHSLTLCILIVIVELSMICVDVTSSSLE